MKPILPKRTKFPGHISGQLTGKMNYQKKVKRFQLLLIRTKYLIKREKLKTLLQGHVLFCLLFSEHGSCIFSVPYATEKVCFVRDTYFLELSVKLKKEKFIAKTLRQIQPFISRVRFLYQITCLGTGTLQSCQNLDH